MAAHSTIYQLAIITSTPSISKPSSNQNHSSATRVQPCQFWFLYWWLHCLVH